MFFLITSSSMDRFGLSLYDDIDSKQKSDHVAGWSSGIKLLQSQMQLKKATQTHVSKIKRDASRKPILGPVLDTKVKKEDESNPLPLITNLPIFPTAPPPKPVINKEQKGTVMGDPQMWDIDWNFDDEYSPFYPNDYEKAVRELRDRRDREKEKEDDERRKRREERARNRERELEERRKLGKVGSDSDEEDDMDKRGGVSIAPPSTLHDASMLDMTPKVGGNHGASVAAKIMAKYGFKEGQGLGKKEQGMSIALQVEKTSKRGGRIIHEKEIKEMMPPPFEFPFQSKNNLNPSPPPKDGSPAGGKSDTSITEIMKEPSKVVLLKNMVGPGEVDQDLEPEVKDECNTKYGDVIKVMIHELPNGPQEEAVRIFVEFKRIESAIKAVIDLNGRFFGGRQVKAGFYSYNRFASYQLLDG